MTQKKWIGVDLDGTLAESVVGNRAQYSIGEAIEPMLNRVKKWIDDGQFEVKIFTARAADNKQINGIQRWLDDNGIGGCKITNQKDADMVAIFDNISIRVEENTGKICDECIGFLNAGNVKFNSLANQANFVAPRFAGALYSRETLTDC
ncbi:hypothetical protein [uncultured Deefgea sp.]|uniref:hypothetical protein n=1 Tax=uncultured Deefgea sp. TaxID=1304914 RepID=UPI002596677F|nr:hypothetical protein [uncultured Deefgea sp.]